jgi:small subunit ribosomal protein S3
MGQKVNPIGIRLGITRDWSSKWYAGSKTFASNIHTDFLVRKYLMKKLADASVSRIHIERAARRANITIHTARPGIVIGKKGEDIEKTPHRRGQDSWHDDARRAPQHRRDPQARARREAGRRGHFAAAREARDVPPRHEARRDQHHAFRRLGIKVRISGRLNGSEIARTETNREGRVPLHTFRADIDYGLPRRRPPTA